MTTCASMCLIAGSAVILVPGWPLLVLSSLIFVWGVGTGGLVLGFAAARAVNPSNASGLTVGLVNTLVVGSGGVCQLLVGFLLDLNWSGEMQRGVRVYEAGDFRLALMSLMVIVVVGLLCIAGARTPAQR